MRSVPGSAVAARPSEGPFRLPRTVEPVAYRLVITPDLEHATFTGTEEVDVVVHEQTDTIVLNAAELDLGAASVVPPAGDEVDAALEPDRGGERVVLRLPAPLAKGEATVKIAFTGTLNDKLRGFYRSTFTDSHGTTRTIATTQMEATDARRAFPCWDEPDRKATFDITLLVDEGLAAFSNSPVAAEDTVVAVDGTKKRRVRFAPTMKMSTYLVAFIVGPLEATEPDDVGGIPVRIVHAPGRAHLSGFALDVARHALEFFGEYFGIPYPGDKLDLVAIPDFAHGAMENLGCVTFRETALLVDPKAAARVELERIADVVHHEIAHMWFGDLVTMGWWEGIWLNEAFATFMEVLATDDYKPAWERWHSFGLERDYALSVDGLHTTRPIEYPVASPEEADGMFDTLTYEKGASVLRMLEQYLGAAAFRDGVRRYLSAHAYGNTVTADLWNALEEVSGEPVRAMADSWILQGGHPLVTLRASSVTQEPFAYLPEPPEGVSAIGRRWLVPLLVRPVEGEAGNGVRRVLLDEETLALPVPADGAAVANAGGWGVYRVGYEPARLGALAARLGDLTPLERFDLVSDTWALVLAGRADLDELVGLAANMTHEQEPAIYQVLASALRLCDRVATDAERPAVRAAARAVLGPRAADLGWEPVGGEGERVPTLRALLIGELGTTGDDADVRREAARRFDAQRDGGAAVDADIESAVLAVVADQVRDGDYDAVLDRYRHPANPQQERRYLMTLGAFADVALCTRSFELAMSEVRRQDGPHLVNALLANRVGAPAVWEQVKTNWVGIQDRFPDVTHARVVGNVLRLCHDPALAADVEAFLTAHPVAVGQRTVAQTLERLRVNVAFAERMRESGRMVRALGALGGG
jgi:puromycin-sensitive aminopeptidase